MVTVPGRARAQWGDVRQPDVESYPWLESVSDDRTTWIIQESRRNRRESKRISLDIGFDDGTRLPDPENRELFEIAVEYLQLVRLYQPVIGLAIHKRHVTGLLTFLYWLNQCSVRSLAQVTPDHIELFTKQSAFGREWALSAPHNLIRSVQNRIRQGIELPIRDDNRLDLSQLRDVPQLQWLRGKSRHTCVTIARWLKDNRLRIDTEKAAEELVTEHGWWPERRTAVAIANSLLPVDQLWRWDQHFSQPTLSFNPYPEGLYTKAAQIGVELKGYPTIPTSIAFPYLRGALRWVIAYAPVILEARRNEWRAAQVRDRLSKVGLEVDLTDKSQTYNEEELTHDNLIRLTAAACFVVIAALTARRRGEIADLGVGCTYQDSDGAHWMRVYIEKTTQEYDQIPIPVAVHQAVRCMEAISNKARKINRNDSIWQFRSVFLKRTVQLRPYQQLNKLAEHLHTDVDTSWHFTAHQLRRLFAMLYFWRYEKGDVAALSHHLRHFDLEMTRRYVTENQFEKIWTDVEDEWRSDVLRGVIEGTRTISGAAGDRISEKIDKLRQQFRKNVDVVAKQRIVDRLLRLARRHDAPCKIHVWGTICVCPQRNTERFARHAKCKGAYETGPVFSQATEQTCARCPFAVHTERFKDAAERALASRGAMANGLSNGALIAEFVHSSCEQLERGLMAGAANPLTGDSGDDKNTPGAEN